MQGHEPEQIRVRVDTTAARMLVLSEVYYPAWRAYVDGERAEVYAANHALRAVAVPAGKHTVELRYESWTLRLGMAITLGMGAVVIALTVYETLRRAEDATGNRAMRHAR